MTLTMKRTITAFHGQLMEAQTGPLLASSAAPSILNRIQKRGNPPPPALEPSSIQTTVISPLAVLETPTMSKNTACLMEARAPLLG